MRRDPGTMARPRATRNPAQKNRGPSRPNLSGFGLSRKPPICPGLLGCFLFPFFLFPSFFSRRINFVYTPKHGSWLNVAECELSCMTNQCLKNRRIGDLEKLQTEIAAWSTFVNEKQRAVDWQFTIAKARVKLKFYPKI